MIELQKCRCGAPYEIEFDLDDIVLRCTTCGWLRRCRGLGRKLLAAFEDESTGDEKLDALLGTLAAKSADNTGTKEGKND